jgi:hypothetical protein
VSTALEWLIDPTSFLDVNLCGVHTARLKHGMPKAKSLKFKITRINFNILIINKVITHLQVVL